MDWKQLLRGLIAVRNRRSQERTGKDAPCYRCEGHGCITIYSISNEYAAPCPACTGSRAYHARVARMEGGYVPRELRWIDPLATPDALKGDEK